MPTGMGSLEIIFSVSILVLVKAKTETENIVFTVLMKTPVQDTDD